jgi:hypothetical protein
MYIKQRPILKDLAPYSGEIDEKGGYGSLNWCRGLKWPGHTESTLMTKQRPVLKVAGNGVDARTNDAVHG